MQNSYLFITYKAYPGMKNLTFSVQTGWPLSDSPRDSLFAPLKMPAEWL